MNEVTVVSKLRRAALLTLLPGRSAQSGQGTVEYVGLILLVSLLMVGMVIYIASILWNQRFTLSS